MINLLFKNINHKQTILKNTFWLGLAQGITGILNFFLAVYVIRAFGPTEYGKFAFALSFVMLFSTFFDFGLSTAVTREFARNQEEKKYFTDILILKSLLGVGALILVIAISFFVIQDKLIQKTIFILGIYLFFSEVINFLYGFFRSQQKMELEAGFRFLQISILTFMIFWILHFSPSILNLSFAYACTTFITFLIIVASLLIKSDLHINWDFSLNKLVIKKFFLIGWYLALSKGAGDIITNAGSVMLGYFGMLTATGLYNAVLKINGLILFPMGLISAAIFPSLIKILEESRERFVKYFNVWMKGTIFFSVLFLFLILAKADRIINLAYSSDFLSATFALKVLIFMATVVYISNLYYHVLLIFDQQKKLFYVFLSGAIINVIANFILIPKFGFNGVAVALALTQFLILCQYMLLTSKHTILKPFNFEFIFTLLVSIVAGFVMYLGISIMKDLNLFIMLSTGVLFYSLLFGGIDKLGRKLVYAKFQER